jgi:PAS domain S-box-containing protein
MCKKESSIIENDHKLKAILKTIPDLLFHFDQHGKFISFFQENRESLIASPDEFLGKTVTDFFGKELSAVFLKAIEQTLTSGHFEHEYELFIEKPRYYSAKYSKINDREVICLVRDVTELKTSEIKIRHLYHQQKLLADISQLLSIYIDPYPILNDVLKLVGEHTGVSRVYIFEDFDNGQTTSNTFEWCNSGISPQIDELQDIPYEIIPSWKNFLSREGRIFSQDITELPEDIFVKLAPQGIKSIIIYPLQVGDIFYGFIGFDECVRYKYWNDDEIDLLRLISSLIANAFERKQVMNKLKESEMRLKLAIEGARQGLWDLNNQTGEVYFNEMWCLMLGYKPHEIAPNRSSWTTLVHPEDLPDVLHTFSRHLNDETEYYESTYRIRTKNGTWKWILDKGLVVQRDENNNPLRTIGSHVDITAQKETEQLLKDSIEIRNKIFSIIAHDLRGPIGSFFPALEMLTSKTDLDEETKNFYLLGLKKASVTTFNLLDNLLNWSLFHTNVFKFRPIQLHINNLIKENLELFASGASQKSITVSLNADREFYVYADKDSINLVMRNLLSNAIKFTPAGGKIEISLTQTGERLKIEVSDTGVGLEQETLDKILNTKIFFSTQGTNNEEGSGLGLFLCKEFIEKNGSELFASSKPGGGSSFWFTLPNRN